ncbi:c-type cytochrome [Thiothrix nivea]|uniref:Cytochrome c class I n=1 Tax=Thiothrix nivea (strain ATCC 35100 / DSM 5205 / JP2) TaxID=870187 RepID=A0A656HMG0_THINJ|nr:c-type cytochrome [Thiothrix nivea]EIJ36215.1 cytochrome c class I [Thiothrix nivea DSM 5205]
MKKIAVSVSALFLALGVLSGCGEKKEEAPKAEAPAQESSTAGNAMDAMKDAAQSAGDAAGQAMDATKEAVGDAAQAAGDAAGQAMDAAKEAAGDAAQAAGDAAQAAGDAAAQAVDATKEAAGDAAQAAGDAAQQAAAPAGAVDGEKVYRGLCFSCHDAGVAGAPKLADKAAWEPRIATGNDAMYTSALNGKNAMPAKGGNPALSEDEVKAAVDWMVAQSK